MNKEANVALNDIIDYFRNNEYYLKCISLKKQMENNNDINTRVEKIKQLQKQYVNSNFSDEDMKEELDLLEKELLDIPIYNEYNRNLEEMNKQIEYFKEEMNHYFNDILNK